MFRKSALFIVLIILLPLLLLSLIFVSNDSSTNGEDNFEEKRELSGTVSLILNFGNEMAPQVYSLEIEDNWTAFDILKKITQEQDIELNFEEYEQGVFIKAIGERANGEDDKYWLYYINDTMPQISCDKKIVSPGDKIEFNFQTSPY